MFRLDVISGKSKEEMQERIQELKSLQGVQLEQRFNQLKDNLGRDDQDCHKIWVGSIMYFIFPENLNQFLIKKNYDVLKKHTHKGYFEKFKTWFSFISNAMRSFDILIKLLFDVKYETILVKILQNYLKLIPSFLFSIKIKIQ